tara:strand:- start:2964 stop:3227 length:264 start_codon:yes stop_codon:yes gene_type:complete
MKYFIKDKTLTKYEKESGKLRMSGGCWTINLTKISLESFNKVVYITERYRYEIDKVWALENGFIKYFGGEDKLVVPIKYWIKDAVSV